MQLEVYTTAATQKLSQELSQQRWLMAPQCNVIWSKPRIYSVDKIQLCL